VIIIAFSLSTEKERERERESVSSARVLLDKMELDGFFIFFSLMDISLTNANSVSFVSVTIR